MPLNERPNFFTEGEVEPQCNNQYVSAENMNAYQFQTEEILTTAGLNLYPFYASPPTFSCSLSYLFICLTLM